MKKKLTYIILLLAICMLPTGKLYADGGPYLLELGMQGGVHYYMGDAQHMIFLHPRETYGAQFRYKFDRRWALQVKGEGSRIAFKYPVAGAGFVPDMSNQRMYTNHMISLDCVGEFNFFRFGDNYNDRRVKPYTPYIFAGVGMSLYDGDKKYSSVGAYIPFGIGFKWKFANHCGLQLAWQHNMYFADNLENIDDYNNVEKLNGSNFLNCDQTGQLTFGLVFDFVEAKKVCRSCNW